LVSDYNWEECDDFINIKNQLHKHNIDVPILPLKYSNGFDVVDDEEKSILQLIETNNLYKHHYKVEAQQLQKFYNLLKDYE